MSSLTSRVSCLALSVLVSGCAAATAKSMYQDVLRKCSRSDQIGNMELYLGPSNGVGPGAVWRRSAGGYNLRWTLDRAIASETARSELIQPGVDASCQGVSATATKLSPSFDVTGVVPVSGQLSGDLNSARKVTLSTDAWRWDQIQELPYENAITHLQNAGNQYAIDLRQPDRFVVGKALRVHGVTAELSFDDQRAGALKAKYPALAVAPGASIDLGVGVNASWSNTTTLNIKSRSDFYIAVQLYPWRETGLAAGRPELLVISPVKVGENASAVTNPEM